MGGTGCPSPTALYDLWNLLPATPKANSEKRDKLVARELLLRRRDAVIHYWDVVRNRFPERFDLEAERTLLSGPLSAENWEAAALSGLLETVEGIALQRGLERWAGCAVAPWEQPHMPAVTSRSPGACSALLSQICQSLESAP
jgi:hypothetical protein